MCAVFASNNLSNTADTQMYGATIISLRTSRLRHFIITNRIMYRAIKNNEIEIQ
jgi:hypothetical protein